MTESNARFSVGAVSMTPIVVDRALGPDDGDTASVGGFFCDRLEHGGNRPQDRDVLVVSSKVAAIFEGRQVRLDTVVPSRKARALGRLYGKDPRKVQLVIEEGKVLLVIPLRWIMRIRSFRDMMAARAENPAAMDHGFGHVNSSAFVVNRHAAYLDEAGIDYTNSPDGYVAMLPADPCATAQRIREAVQQRFSADIGVIITDTVTCIGRVGSQDTAIGYAGMDPITRVTFSNDLFGTPRSGGIDVVIDSIAGMAGLVMGQTVERTPAVLVRGISYLPQRDDDGRTGMAQVAYPPGVKWRINVLTVLATACFKGLNLLTFQPWRRARRSIRRQ